MTYIANVLLDYNYIFLMRGDGTPYDIVYNFEKNKDSNKYIFMNREEI